jgi:putative Mn2+ efflux pump MntP
MPILGRIAGEQVRSIVSSVVPIIAFILLLIIGLKMIYESIDSDE